VRTANIGVESVEGSEGFVVSPETLVEDAVPEIVLLADVAHGRAHRVQPRGVEFEIGVVFILGDPLRAVPLARELQAVPGDALDVAPARSLRGGGVAVGGAVEAAALDTSARRDEGVFLGQNRKSANGDARNEPASSGAASRRR
jgi:hypothetical protein